MRLGTRNKSNYWTLNRKFALCVRLCVIESKQRFNAPETKTRSPREKKKKWCNGPIAILLYFLKRKPNFPHWLDSPSNWNRAILRRTLSIQTTHLPPLFITQGKVLFLVIIVSRQQAGRIVHCSSGLSNQ